MLKLKNSAMLVVAAFCGYLALMTPDWKSDLVAASGVAYLNDQNGDGKADVLLRNASTGEFSLSLLNGLSVLNTLDPGAFNDPENVVVSTGDFNGDGNADILTRGTINGLLPGTFKVELTDSTGQVFDTAWMNTMSTDVNDVVVSTKDFNFDGKADVLLRNSSTGAWTMNYMNGTSDPAIGNLPGVTTDLCYSFKGDGDYDGNLVPDILLRKDQCGTPQPWTMYTMKGDFNYYKTATPAVTQSVQYDVIDTDHDWNGDGRDDVLVRFNTGSPKQWVLYFMAGAVATPLTQSTLPQVAVQSMWDYSNVGDFNGDGWTDLMIREHDTGQWYAYLMNGANLSGTPSFLSAAIIPMNQNLVWTLQDTDDFNGDGKTDVLLRNSADGTWQANLMNGLTPTSGSLSGSPAVVTDLAFSLQND